MTRNQSTGSHWQQYKANYKGRAAMGNSALSGVVSIVCTFTAAALFLKLITHICLSKTSRYPSTYQQKSRAVTSYTTPPQPPHILTDKCLIISINYSVSCYYFKLIGGYQNEKTSTFFP